MRRFAFRTARRVAVFLSHYSSCRHDSGCCPNALTKSLVEGRLTVRPVAFGPKADIHCVQPPLRIGREVVPPLVV
jgi:hypothetical protein